MLFSTLSRAANVSSSAPMSSSIPTLTTGEMSGSAQEIKQKTADVCMTFQKVSLYPKFPDGLQGNIPKGIQNFSQRGCLQHFEQHPSMWALYRTLCCVGDMWEMNILATKASLNLQNWADIRCFFCSCLQQIRDLLCEGGHPNAACHVTPNMPQVKFLPRENKNGILYAL
jgi:hypothetical protein